MIVGKAFQMKLVESVQRVATLNILKHKIYFDLLNSFSAYNIIVLMSSLFYNVVKIKKNP